MNGACIQASSPITVRAQDPVGAARLCLSDVLVAQRSFGRRVRLASTYMWGIVVFALSAIAPEPTGAGLVARVACVAGSSSADIAHHQVTIRADWSVETPHDIDSERVSVAFGGVVSCVELVDRVVPAMRDHLQLAARRAFVQLTRVRADRWTAGSPVDGCCTSEGFSTAPAAATHVRSVDHVAAAHSVDVTVLRPLTTSALRAHGQGRGWQVPRHLAGQASHCVKSERGVKELWDAGIHPDVVLQVHQRVAPDRRALPTWFYLGVVTRRPDLAWITHTVCIDTADLAEWPTDLHEWLPWTQTDLDRREPDARSQWLRSGVPRSLVVELSDAGYTASDIESLARIGRRSRAGAAATLSKWIRAGARPTIEELARLHRLDVPVYAGPSRGAVDRLRQTAADSGLNVRDVDVPLLVTVCGCVPVALSWLQTGHTDPFDVAAAIARGETSLSAPAATKGHR